jgi:hypothetical protein
MIETSQGQLTIVDANKDKASLFWKGEKLSNVLSFMTIKSHIQQKVTVKVTKLTKVSPALSTAEMAHLNAIYIEMEMAGITVQFGA